MAEYNKIGKGHAIGEYTHEDGLKTTVYESITGLVDLSLTGNVLTLKYKGEDLVEQTYSTDFSSLVPNSSISSGAYDPATNTVTLTKADGSTVSFVINELTSLTLAGSELTFTDENGTPNKIDLNPAIKLAETTTVLKTFSLSGNVITLVYTDEDGVDQEKTVDLSSLTPGSAISGISDVDPATGEITITKFDGSEFTVKVDALTSLAFNGTTGVTFTDETGTINTVDLKTLVQNAETDTSVSGAITTGHEIGKYVNEAGTNFSIQETITSIANFSLNAGNNTILLDFNKEDGTVQQLSLDLSTLAIDTIASIEVDTTTPGGPWLVITNSNGSEDRVKLSDVFDTINHTLSSSGNTLTSVVGGTTQTADIINSISASITSAANLQLNVNGITSSNLDLTPAIKDAETDTVVQNTVIGHKIADYTNEAGVVKDINETITTFNAGFDDITYLFTLTYVDENGATTSKVLDLKVLAPLIIKSTVVTNETGFHKDDGTITITADGGRTPFEYSKDGGVTWQSSNVFTNVVAGTYTIVVKNANGDSKSVIATVTQPDDLVVTATSTNETSFDANNGTITTASTGGVAPITYSIDGVNYQSSPLFSNLVAGVYTVYGKDGVGDVHTTSVTITQPADLTLVLTSATNETAFDANNGSIIVTAAGGVGTYSYSIDGGVTWQASNIFSNVQAGTYSIIVRDQATPTIDTATVSGIVITQPDDLVAVLVSTTNETAFDKNDGVVVLSQTGGVGPFTYSKDGGVTFQSSATFTGLTAGSYTFVVKDSTGDTSSVTSTITQPADLSVSLSSQTNASIFGATDGVITVTAAGGVAPLEYSKDGGATWQSSPTFSGLGAGNYNIIVRDSSGDTATVAATITQPTDVVLNFSKTNESVAGNNDGTITLSGSGGSGVYQYSIDGGVTWQSSGSFTNLAPGNYNVVVKDGNGDTASNVITISAGVPATVAITISRSASSFGTLCSTAVNGIDGWGVGSEGVIQYTDGSNVSQTATLPSLGSPDSITVYAKIGTSVTILSKAIDLAGNGNVYCSPETKTYQAYVNNGADLAVASIVQVPADGGATTAVASYGFTATVAASFVTYIRDITSAVVTTTTTAGIITTTTTSGGGGTALSVTAVGTDETASGANDGTITATGAGGTAPYEYSIDGVNFQSSNVFSNLAPNTYTVTVRDSTSATATTSVTIAAGSGGVTIPPAPSYGVPCDGVQIFNDAANTSLVVDTFNPGAGGTTQWSECINNGYTLQIGEQIGFVGSFDNNASMQISVSSSCNIFYYVNNTNIATSNKYAVSGLQTITGYAALGIGDVVKILVVQL